MKPPFFLCLVTSPEPLQSFLPDALKANTIKEPAWIWEMRNIAKSTPGTPNILFLISRTICDLLPLQIPRTHSWPTGVQHQLQTKCLKDQMVMEKKFLCYLMMQEMLPLKPTSSHVTQDGLWLATRDGQFPSLGILLRSSLFRKSKLLRLSGRWCPGGQNSTRCFQ